MERQTRNIHRLTTAKIRAITKPGLYSDGGNLYVLVGPGGGKSWVFRYTRRHQQHDLGLGPLSAFTLDQARARAKQQRELLADGLDPLTVRRQEQQRLASIRTFQEAAAEFLAVQSAKWTNEVHRKQWTQTLAQYVYPRLGATPVTEIDAEAVVNCIRPIWATKRVTAERVLNRISRVLDYTMAKKYRPKGPNPAAWAGNLEYLLPAQNGTVTHLAAMPYADIPAFMVKLRARRGPTEQSQLTALTLEWCILTATRIGETRGMTEDEVDYERRLWTIPATRMKAKREQVVPLPERLMEIYASILFGGPRTIGRKLLPVSDSAVRNLAKRIAGLPITVHGFRSSFRDWAAETGVRRELAEAALAHKVVGDKTEAAYNRTALVEQRRTVMQAWADFAYSETVAEK